MGFADSEGRVNVQVVERTAGRGGGPGPRVQTVKVDGTLDAHTFGVLEEAVRGLLERGASRVVFNFEGLDYISSSGLGVIIQVTKKARDAGGDVRLAAVPEKIRNVMEILGYTSVVKTFEDEEGAVASFAAK